VHKLLLNNVKKEKYVQNLRATKFNRMLIIFQFRSVLIYDTGPPPAVKLSE